MASAHPIVRQVKWIFVIPQVIMLILFTSIFYLTGILDPLLFGVLTYLIVSYTVRTIIPKHHRKGILFLKSSLFNKAIEEFKKSYEFFTKHKWIDNYRYIFLFSSSRVSYLEMAMLNMAYCYGQLGDGSKSKELYQKTFEQFPGSKMAESALKMFDAAKNI